MFIKIECLMYKGFEEKYKIFKTYAALSKIYGVSTKTIKKWLLSYDIKL